MLRLVIFGATGSLGGQVLRQAVAAGHEVTALVRTPSKLPADLARRVSVHAGDLSATVPVDLVRGQDALVNCAGHVAEGERFVALVDRVVTGIEVLPPSEQPVCWFLAGAALLDIDAAGRRAVDLPAIAATYWPHRVNFDRLRRSRLDWRLLCPGPLAHGPALGVDRLRVSIDALPLPIPARMRDLQEWQLAPAFASLVPEMVVPYADAAAVMLANLGCDDPMSRHRVGLALPARTPAQEP